MSLRIVSLLPSATEIICALGLKDSLVGVSHECDHPKGVERLPRLTAPKLDPSGSSATIDREVRAILKEALSVYRIDTDTLAALKPDLIVTQDQCEVCAVSLEEVESACRTLGLPSTRIVSLRPNCLADVKADFQRVAEAAELKARGEALIQSFEQGLAEVRSLCAPLVGESPVRALCVEWLEPPMIAGGWLPELVQIAGGQPMVVTEPGRFATVDWAGLLEVAADVVVLMPCGFDISKTLGELAHLEGDHPLRRMRATREGRCFVVDGNAFFNRPGPRLVESAKILAGAFHPRIARAPGGVIWP